MKRPPVLVAGVGNIFLGDDGFGVEVARRLGARSLPPGVRVADFGIRGIHLAYELLDGYEWLIVVDALDVGEQPGTLAVLEPDESSTASGVVDAHGMDPASVLDRLRDLGGSVGRVTVVGCQPATVDEGIGLSGPVGEAVNRAVELVLSVLSAESSALSAESSALSGESSALSAELVSGQPAVLPGEPAETRVTAGVGRAPG